MQETDCSYRGGGYLGLHDALQRDYRYGGKDVPQIESTDTYGEGCGIA